MSSLTLQEKYEKSKRSVYKPIGNGDSIYPNIGGIFSKKRDFENSKAEHESKYIDPRRTDLSELYAQNRQRGRKWTDDDVSGRRRAVTSGSGRNRSTRSPIRILKDPLTPIRSRNKRLFKMIDSTPREGRYGGGNGTVGADSDRNGGSRKSGFFNKLRGYLSNLNAADQEDDAFSALKSSARELLDIQVDEKKPKKVVFDERKANIDKIDLDNDPVDEVINTSTDTISEVELKGKLTELKKLIEKERRENSDLVKEYEDKISTMQIQHANECDRLKKEVEELQEKLADKNSSEKQARLDELEQELFRKHERFLVAKKKQESALQDEREKLERAKRELERNRRTPDPPSTAVLPITNTLPPSSHRPSTTRKNEKIQILRDKKELTRAVRQLEAEYREVCLKTGTVFIPLMKANSMSKYRSILLKFDEYSSILKTLDTDNTQHLIEINGLFNLLHKNLLASSNKKNRKLEQLQRKTSAIYSSIHGTLYGPHDVYSVYNRCHSVLNDLLSIQELLLQLNFLTTEVNRKLRTRTQY